MKKSILLSLLALLLPSVAFADYNGTPVTPQKSGDCYQIGTAEELYGFAAVVNAGDGTTSFCGELTADITVNENVLDADGNLNDAPDGGFKVWTPIGMQLHEFRGRIQGNHHVIRGLYFKNSATSYVGLVGWGVNSEIKNLGLEDSYIEGNSYVGGLVGEGGATISNSYNSGTVTGSGGHVGGLVGGGSATISNSYNSGAVTGSGSSVGGLVGDGGATISNSYNSGTVTSYNGTVGGLVGGGSVDISASYNEGLVRSVDKEDQDQLVGSLVGGLVGQVNGNSFIANTYNAGSVKAGDNVGGLVGYVDGNQSVTIVNSHNVGQILRDGDNGAAIVGWVLGSATVINSFAKPLDDGEYWGENEGNVVIGSCNGSCTVSESKIKSAEEFAYGDDESVEYVVNMLQNYSDEVNGTTVSGSVWGQSAGDTYPKLTGVSFLYGIAYNLNGGSFTNGAAHAYTSGSETVLAAPSRNGYTFDGWYENADFSGSAVTSIADDATGAKTYYARWVKIPTLVNKGTANECYAINDADDLYGFAAIVNGVVGVAELPSGYPSGSGICGKLTANIVVNEHVLDYSDAEGNDVQGCATVGNCSRVWTPMVGFTGSFDGNGHSIGGLYFSDASQGNVGLFASVESSGKVRRVSVVDSYFEGNGNVGSIVGINGGRIVNCNNVATVKGTTTTTGWAGGIAGFNSSTGYIANCQSVGSVSGRIRSAREVFGQSEGNYEYNLAIIPGDITKWFRDGSTAISAHNWCEKDTDGKTCKEGGENGLVWGQHVGHDDYPVLSNSYDENGNLLPGEVKFDLDYVLDGGAIVDGNVVTYTHGTITTLPTPTRNSDTFIGWYESADFSGNVVTAIAADATGAKTFYAKWTEKVNYVLNSDDAVLSGAPASYVEGEGVLLVDPTRTGCTFAGWYESADFSGDVVTSISASETGAKTFYAKWNVGINYVLNADDAVLSGAPASYVEGFGVLLVDPARFGYAFAGWYDNIQLTGDAVTSIAASETGVKTFYAKWTEAEKTIVWNETDGCYEIYNADGLYEFAQIVNGNHAAVAQNTAARGKLMNNIVVNGSAESPLLEQLVYDGKGNVMNGSNFRAWTPIGTDAHPFSGSFDGNGKTISGLYDNNGVDYAGLIANARNASISNVGVVDSYFEGAYSVGGLVGVVDGQVAISNSYNQGLTKGKVNVGGLVGEDNGELTVLNSYNAGKVEGTGSYGGSNVGALVGYMGTGTITNSFAMEGVASKLVADGDGSGAAFKTGGEFHDGTVATLLHNGTNGSIWGQNLANTNSLPDFGGAVEYRYGSIVVSQDKSSATLLGNSQLTVDIPSGQTITARNVEIDRTFVPSAAGTPIANTIVLPFSTTPNTTANASFYAFKGLAKEGGVYSAKFAETIDPANLVANTPYVAILNVGATTLKINLGSPVTMESGDAKTVGGSVGETTVGETMFNGESGWSFVGTYAYKHWDDACSGDECVYGFAAKAGTLRNGTPYAAGDFVKAGKNVSILPMRAYLKKTLPSGLHGAPSLNGKSLVEVPEVIECEFLSGTGAVAAVGQMNARTGEITLKKADSWFDMKGRSLGSKKPTAKGSYYNNGKMVIIK